MFPSIVSESGVCGPNAIFTVQGELDIAAFEQVWQQAIDYHPALRSAFQGEPQPPVQGGIATGSCRLRFMTGSSSQLTNSSRPWRGATTGLLTPSVRP